MLGFARAAGAALRRGAGASAPRRGVSFASAEEHLAALNAVSVLPSGFRVGTHGFEFKPREVPDRTARMTLTLIAMDKPSAAFGAMFTSNAFPGAPVVVGRKRVAESPALQAVVINNKISNVCAPGGEEDSERVCGAVAKALGLPSASLVFPSSTGIIGWKLPADDMVAAVPAATACLQAGSILPAAKGICTTDLYPKVRAASLPGGGRVVGIAKGAGMVEPGLATMLVYLLTDAGGGDGLDSAALRAALREAVHPSFNSLSIDSDMSTSDTVLALASGGKPMPRGSLPAFGEALQGVCAALAEDIVRNGEGVQHVIRVKVSGAPSLGLARAVGKSVVNSPLFKAAVAGNDPNVGRLVAAIGKCVGAHPEAGSLGDMRGVELTMGGRRIFAEGRFLLDPAAEKELVAHLRGAQLWESRPSVRRAASPLPSSSPTEYHYSAADVLYATPVTFPPHERCVEVGVDLGFRGPNAASTVILGADLTHEYVTENADYRS